MVRVYSRTGSCKPSPPPTFLLLPWLPHPTSLVMSCPPSSRVLPHLLPHNLHLPPHLLRPHTLPTNYMVQFNICILWHHNCVDIHCHCTGDQVTAAAQFSPSPATPNRAPPHSFVDGHEDQASVGSAGTPSHPHRYTSHHVFTIIEHVCGWSTGRHSFTVYLCSLCICHYCWQYSHHLFCVMTFHSHTSSHRVGEVVRTASNKYVSSVHSRYVCMTALMRSLHWVVISFLQQVSGGGRRE